MDGKECLLYLHKPGQKEDECDEIEVGAPAGEAVNGSVHEENPALLRGGFIHRENAGSCHKKKGS